MFMFPLLFAAQPDYSDQLADVGSFKGYVLLYTRPLQWLIVLTRPPHPLQI